MKYILEKILNIFLSAVILVGTTVNFPVSADISSDIESFDIGSISNENVMKITKDINLPGYFRAASGVGYKIKWTSSKPDIISTTGRVHASADLESVTLTAQFTSAKNTDLVSSKSYSTAVLPEGKTIEYLDFNDYPDTLKNKSLNGYDNWRVTVAEDEYHGAETVLATDPADGANKLVNATRFNVHGTTATPTIYDERAGRYFKDENGANVSLAGKVYVGARIKYTPPQDGVFTYTQPFSAPGPFQLQVCSSTGVLLTEIKMFKGNRHIYYIIPSPTAENPKKTVEADSGKQISEGE